MHLLMTDTFEQYQQDTDLPKDQMNSPLLLHGGAV